MTATGSPGDGDGYVSEEAEVSEDAEVSEERGQGAKKRRGLRFFSRANPVVGDWTLSRPPTLDQPARDALPEFSAAGGSARSVMFCDPDGAHGKGLSLIWLRFGGGYPLPRHSHTADCLYYVVAGEVHLGNRTVSAGEGFFAPADAPYSYVTGPDGVELIEFRAVTAFDSQIRESPEGWQRNLAAVRANRDKWPAQLAAFADDAHQAPVGD